MGHLTTTGARPRALRALLGALLVLLAWAPAAAAEPPRGALRQLAGTTGCVSQTGSGGACADVRGVDGAQFVTVSPDGRHAYVASVASNAVAAFSRAAGGELTQLAGTEGCVAKVAAEGCATGRAVAVPDWVTLSPGGEHVYVSSAESDATAIFSRDPATGALTQLPGAAGCVSSNPAELSCGAGRALDLAAGVVLSPDGRNAYVASFLSDAIAVFSRDPSTGELTQLAGQAGCVSQTDGSCAPAGSMDGLSSVSVSPDGENVYATARWSDAVTVYARDATTGALTRVAGTDGCVAAVASAGCTQGNGLDGSNTVVSSQDGAHVYVGSFEGSSLAVFSRNTETGKLTQLPGDQGCFDADGTEPACAPATALDGTFSLTQTPDGVNVYVAAYDSDAVSVFSRDAASGALAQLEGIDGCVSNTGTGGQCATVGVLDGAHHVAVDPEGKHAYAPANISDAVAAFDILPGDITPPETAISSGPEGAVNESSPSFAFASSEPGSSYECRLDGPDGVAGSFEPCSSPRDHTGLADGAYEFSVRATDTAGNVDPSPAAHSFTVDTAAPETSIASGPEGDTNEDSPSFGFESSEPGSSFECRLNGPEGAGGAFEPCSSPKAYAELTNGEYTFSVRTTDAAANADPSPATRVFRLDDEEPETRILSGPQGPTSDISPEFTFEGDGAAGFECRLDGPGAVTGAYEECESPKAYEGLADGTYVFSVRAYDSAGNVDSSPVTRDLNVDTAVTPAPPRSDPPDADPPAPATPGSGVPVPEPASPGTGAPLTFGLSLHPPRELTRTLRRGLRLPVSCESVCTVRVRALVDRRTARRVRFSRHGAPVLVGRGATRVDVGAGRVRVRFTREARRRMRRLRRARLLIEITATDAAGTTTTRSTVTLRRYTPRLGAALRRGVPVWLRCFGAPCRAEARLVLHRRSARRLRLGRRSLVVASGHGLVEADRDVRLRLRFTRSARRALARSRGVRLTFWLELHDPAGRPATVRRRVVLRP